MFEIIDQIQKNFSKISSLVHSPFFSNVTMRHFLVGSLDRDKYHRASNTVQKHDNK